MAGSLARALDRGAWLDGLMAGVATLSVALPLGSVLVDTDWLRGAALLVGAIVVVGALVRTIAAPPTMVVLVQALVWFFGILWGYLSETLWWGLPTTATIDTVGDRLVQAGDTLQTYAAPAPVNEGVELLIVALIGLVALSVDSISASGRSPAVAGIPLAAAFLVSVSNSGRGLDVRFFILSASLWLVMILLQSSRVFTAWSSLRVSTRSVGWAHRGVGVTIGLLAAGAAVAIVAITPHLPPTFLAGGLGRDPDGRSVTGGSTSAVSFAETMDPAADLRSQSTTPVLVYQTDAGRPAPLRITATSEFRDGIWQQPSYADSVATPAGSPLRDESAIRDIDPSLTADQVSVVITENNMAAPFLAVPTPIARASLEVDSRYDERTGAIRVESAPSSYRVDYLALDLVQVSDEDVSGDAGAHSPEYLDLDPASEAAIRSLAAEITATASSDLHAANLIQQHLRSTRYTYSLTLEPGGSSSDPITHFLQTRQGYCVQFATAMVMMARAEGIPARMAVGFLPGERQPDGSRVVLANDAHTWPELYLDGLGWTRFEPTPGSRSGIPPAYSLGNPAGEGEEPTSDTETTAPSAPATAPELPPEDVGAPDVSGESGQSADGVDLGTVTSAVLRGLLVLLVIAAILAVLPWAGRRYRQAGLRTAHNSQDRVEGQWTLLTRSLADLGIDPPAQRSPREMQSHYRGRLPIEGEADQAWQRMTTTLERSRYAAPSLGSDTSAPAERAARAGTDTLDADVSTIISAAADSRPTGVRLRARFFPRSGRNQLAQLFRRSEAGRQLSGNGATSETADPADGDRSDQSR